MILFAWYSIVWAKVEEKRSAIPKKEIPIFFLKK